MWTAPTRPGSSPARRRFGSTLVIALVACLLATMLAAQGALAAPGERVFAIGAADGSTAEFALAPNGYADYPRTFPDDVRFDAGGDPKAGWSYIHPGPNDAWAGNKAHPFRINATLAGEQVTESVLQIHYTDTHNSGPPTLEVKVNGRPVERRQLPAGGGTGYQSGAPGQKPSTMRMFIPASMLRSGANEITLANVTGSWSVYDSVELLTGPTGPPDVAVEKATPTVLFVKDQGADRQLVDLTMNNSGGRGQVEVTVTTGNTTATTEVEVAPEISTTRVKVPPAPGPGPVRLTVEVTPGGGRLETSLPHQRRWELHLDHGSHLDIGYTALQPVIRQQQNQFLDTVIDACERTAGYPDDARFRWGIESAWVLDNYVKDRPAAQVERLKNCVRSGQIEVSASYDNNLHDLQSSEQLVRSVYAGAKRYEKRFDTDVVSAFENDSPAVTWQYVQALKKAGTKYLVVGANPTRAPQSPQVKKPNLFWWQAPNGDRLLTWYTGPDVHYGEAYFNLFPGGDAGADFDGSVNNVDRRLREVAAQGYDKDVYLSMFRQDNLPPETSVSDFARRFNETYTWPKVVVSTPKRFFGAVERRGAAGLPVNRGDSSDWWVDGAGSSARETALTRDAQDRTTDAETLGALATLGTPNDGRRQQAVDEAYRQGNLYTEHTWGAAALSWDDPQWPIKRAFAEDADRLSRSALDSSLADLGGQVRNGTPWPGVAVFNGQSWSRDGLVTATVPEGRLAGRGFRLADGSREVPYELVARRDGKITLRFGARDVPSLGYKRYTLLPAGGPGAQPGAPAAADPALRADRTGVENRYYKVTLDPATGAIKSIFDKARRRELIDQSAPFKANQFLYRPNDAGANRANDRPTSDRRQWTPTDASVKVVSSGPVTATIEVTHSTAPGGAVTGVKGLTERISLTADTPRVDLANTVDKTRVETAEEAYYAFPFAADRPDVAYETPGSPTRFFRDQLPGSAMDWITIGRYADVSGRDGGGVLFSAPSAPMVEFDRVRTQEWVARPGRLDGGPAAIDPARFQPRKGWVFSYTHNNLWFTNYRIAQEGPVTFRYSIGGHAGGFDATAATRFGGNVHSALHAAPLAAGQHGTYEPGARSLVAVDRPGVTVQTVKRADDGEPGLTVRLLEVVGRSGTARLRLPFAVGDAALADPTERPIRGLAARGDEVEVPVEGHGIVTVRIRPKLSVTASAGTTTLARGERTDVTVQLRNDSGRTVSGSLGLAAPEGLSVSPAGVPFSGVPPGGTATGRFTVTAGQAAELGDRALEASVTGPGLAAPPTRLTMSVVDPVDLVADSAKLDLVAGVPLPAEITATNNLDRTVEVTVGARLPEGWSADPPSTKVKLEPGQSRPVPIKITPAAGASGDATVTITAASDAAGTELKLPATVSRKVAMVGAVDRGTGEFALSPASFGQFPARFPGGVDFTVGTDDPAEDWSYIHPGPADGWAGNREHKFTVRFDLPSRPSGDLTLTAWLLDTNNFNTPVVRPAVNGAEGTPITLRMGGGDGFHWGDGRPNEHAGIQPATLDVTLPADRLRAGENVVTLSIPSGSWVVYDAFGIRQRP